MSVSDIDVDEHHAIVCCDDHAAHHRMPNPEHIGGCRTCEDIVLHRCSLLIVNLAIAGALCWSFELGHRWPYYLDYEDMADDYEWSDWGSAAWRPGCGRSAP